MSTKFPKGSSRHQPVRCLFLKMGTMESLSQVEVFLDQRKSGVNCITLLTLADSGGTIVYERLSTMLFFLRFIYLKGKTYI